MILYYNLAITISMENQHRNPYIELADFMRREPLTPEKLEARGWELKKGKSIPDVYNEFHSTAQELRRHRPELETIGQGLSEVVVFTKNQKL